MATKPAPTAGAKKPAAKPAAKTTAKPGTKPAAKTSSSTKHTAASTKKTSAKHAPAKPALSPQVQALIKQDVTKLVAADVQKTLASMGIHPATKKPAPKTAAKKPAAKPAAKGTAARGAPLTLDALPCCPYEALAASLRMTGKPVEPDDVLALYAYATDGSGAPTSILAALVAAQHVGLAGAYPTFRWAERPDDGLVVGATIPAGPHAVTLHNGGVWSWGEWRPLTRPLTIEEAWVVSWH